MTQLERAVVGTAGHIDHGKTALVRALTGVDTDRLPEEKARGITIDLGFAELPREGDLQTGVVDVPGHEDFIRAMVAGATGVDVVLLVVAADEGVMPQTTEHLDIIGILGVPRVVVALTKADLVDEDWLALVEDDVRSLLEPTPYGDAPLIPTSVTDGRGLEEILQALRDAARHSRPRPSDDLTRLPVDRVFTLQGTGTVVTGTLRTGALEQGDTVRLLPQDIEARVRSLQVHGRDVDEARAGERTAVALAGTDRRDVARGSTLVTSPAWSAARMLTARIRLLDRSSWQLEQGQRVHVHLGTAEVLARCALLDSDVLEPGEETWVQLRLEEPMVARAGDAVVLRSYSPVTTIGGGTVVEPDPPKRKRLDRGDREHLQALLATDAEAGLGAVLALAGWAGVAVGRLPVLVGAGPDALQAALEAMAARSGLVARDRAFGPAVVEMGEERVLGALRQGHEEAPLRPAVALDRLRRALPAWSAHGLADALIDGLRARGALELAHGGARLAGFEPALTEDQAAARDALEDLYREADLAPPFRDELPDELAERPDVDELIRLLEGAGRLRTVADGLYYHVDVLARTADAVREALGGRADLGPADFRSVLDVSRRHLMPLLSWLDGEGVTVRRGPVREVPPAS